MLRTHTCGELRTGDVNSNVVLAGWVQRTRDKGSVLWIDLRDRYGITQLLFEEGKTAEDIFETARGLGREFVIQAKGVVQERISRNDKLATGAIEIRVTALRILSASRVPPFTIEDETDGGEELRMKYRYLDLRRKPVRESLVLRHRLASETRQYLDQQGFMEIETPVLVKSTPEGARDFVVPSRVHNGEFYALPQSPQTFKQLLMVSGLDRYYQIVRCFRDEDLRADRQPEFTQIDCEMSFVERDDILEVFEGLVRHLFKTVKDVDLPPCRRMSYQEAMQRYGSDKPDLRFDMSFIELKNHEDGVSLIPKKAFRIFDDAPFVAGICAPGCAEYSRKELDALIDYVKRPQVGAKGLIYVQCRTDGSLKSSVDKFYTEQELKPWKEAFQAKPGDLLLIMAGEGDVTRKQLCELRLHMGDRLGMRNADVFEALWVIDFPLLEWNGEISRWQAVHHPFTSPVSTDIELLSSNPKQARANAYDMVVNGVELGGGSIRIHDRETQQKMFSVLGFTPEEAAKQFGFLMNAFEYGAPPHGGIAFGFDRLCALFGGSDSIRDYIAFPKNNAGRDVMIDTPSAISVEQLNELGLTVNKERATRR